MNVLDLFSGIGGFSLGLERAGMTTVALCEIDKPCRRVLKKHWPDKHIFSDITNLFYRECIGTFHDRTKEYRALCTENMGQIIPAENIDVICGGYPCTGHSVAGSKKGFKDEKSALWREYLRLAREIKPSYCIIENSPNLRNTGLAELLKAFDEIGYNAEFSVISAYSVGAPHQRERLYSVFWRKELPYCNPFRSWQADFEKEKASQWWWSKRRIARNPVFKQASKIVSKVLQLNDGVSSEMARNLDEKIKQMGNAVVPQIPELIGRAIMGHE